MKDMMSQVKNCNESYSTKCGLGQTWKRSYRLFIAGLTVLCTVFIGCENPDPFVNPGTTENPNWEVTQDSHMTASMTAVVKVKFTDKEGTLAAFIGDDCCGVAEYMAEYGLYWLFISPVTESGGEVQLRFYSPDLKRVFDAKETFAYTNDGHLGTVAEPYTPEWVYGAK